MSTNKYTPYPSCPTVYFIICYSTEHVEGNSIMQPPCVPEKIGQLFIRNGVEKIGGSSFFLIFKYVPKKNVQREEFDYICFRLQIL